MKYLKRIFAFKEGDGFLWFLFCVTVFLSLLSDSHCNFKVNIKSEETRKKVSDEN